MYGRLHRVNCAKKLTKHMSHVRSFSGRYLCNSSGSHGDPHNDTSEKCVAVIGVEVGHKMPVKEETVKLTSRLVFRKEENRVKVKSDRKGSHEDSRSDLN